MSAACSQMVNPKLDVRLPAPVVIHTANVRLRYVIYDEFLPTVADPMHPARRHHH